jgi:hypothetical protein
MKLMQKTLERIQVSGVSVFQLGRQVGKLDIMIASSWIWIAYSPCNRKSVSIRRGPRRIYFS